MLFPLCVMFTSLHLSVEQYPDPMQDNGNWCLRCGRAPDGNPAPQPSYRVRGNPAVINGDLENSENFPWEVLVEQESEGVRLACTGAIISSRFILTAAHCLLNQDSQLKCKESKGHPPPQCWPAFHLITVSKHNGHFRFPIDGIFPNPYFFLPTYNNDIALLRMQYPINCRFGIMPICLPYPNFFRLDQEIVQVAGWGKSVSKHEPVAGNSTFREGKMRVVNDRMCSNYFDHILPGTFICMVGIQGQSICEGDSGGSAFVQYHGLYYAIGVTSLFGGADCTPGMPDVFTQIAAYLGWIESVVPDIPKPDIFLGLSRN